MGGSKNSLGVQLNGLPPKAVTLMVTHEVEEALRYLSENETQKSVINKALARWEKFDEKHIDFLLRVTQLNENLWLPEDYQPYLGELEGDKLTNKLIVHLFNGFSGSRQFGQQFRKIKSKELKGRRKTLWMDAVANKVLDTHRERFGLSKSQTFDLLIKFHLRVSGKKEDIDHLQLEKLSVDVEAMMDGLNEHFKDIKKSLQKLQAEYPEHFEFADWSKERMEFDDDGLVGWDGVLANFPVLMNHFKKYVLENSIGLTKHFYSLRQEDGVYSEEEDL